MANLFDSDSLLAIVSDADEDLPAIVALHAVGELVDATGSPYPNQPVGEGPWIVCFSEPAVVDDIRGDEFLDALLLQNATIGRLAAERVLAYAREEGAGIILDPFRAGGKTLGRDELPTADTP